MKSNDDKVKKIIHDLQSATRSLKVGLESSIGDEVDLDEKDDYIKLSIDVINKIQNNHKEIFSILKKEGLI